MDLYSILPVIVPAAFMQVLVQATFIRHCLCNSALSKRAKVLTIAAIAVFNIPAAAFYLFLSRPKDGAGHHEIDDTEAENNIRQGTFVLLTVAFEMLCLRILALGDMPDPEPATPWLLSVCFIGFILQGLLVRPDRPLLLIGLPSVQIILIMTAFYLDKTDTGQFLVLIVMAGIINVCPLKIARIHSLLTFIAFLSVGSMKMVVSYPPQNADTIISTAYINILVFAMVYMAFYMLKRQLITNKLLREQSLKLEEMAVLRERSRITGEIHDTVGHTLTSAAIAIEAGERLMGSNLDAAREKLKSALEQVQKGLLDIRQAVRTIQSGEERDFEPAVYELAAVVQKRTGLAITAIITVRTPLLPIQQSVLLNAIKECATNSLKHGHATLADLLIQEHKGTVTFTYTDNGEGIDNIQYGFGLSNMSRQAAGIGGTMDVQSGKGEGFTVLIMLPVGIAVGGEQA